VKDILRMSRSLDCGKSLMTSMDVFSSASLRSKVVFKFKEDKLLNQATQTVGERKSQINIERKRQNVASN